MRYYQFAFHGSLEEIKEKSTIKMNNYESPLETINNYYNRTMKNEQGFFAYREEEEIILAAFFYNERKAAFQEIYEELRATLKELFSVNKIQTAPYEVTIYQFMESYSEARRRGILSCTRTILGSAKLWFYDNYANNDPSTLYFDFQERIVPEKKKRPCALYDSGFLSELSNIGSHGNDSGFEGNMVHYVISSRSVEAASDMTETLMQSLLASRRLSSRRIEIIREIEPGLIYKQNYLEEIIENNHGGAVVFDLSEKFGHEATEYVVTARYIEKLLKKYRNDCLFVFTYNMDHPGYSYLLLPRIKKYVIPVTLREGRGDRKAAIRYMKALIKESQYAAYADQAAEYMKLYPGKEFSQTEILMAFEQFEAWCLNKNVLHAYTYDRTQGFALDRDEAADSSYDKLQKMVGLQIVKKQIDRVIAADIVEKERRKRKGKDYQSGSMHMIFGGNPGTAKTTVAKLFAGIAKEKGILKSGAFVERAGMDLDGLGGVYAIREAFLAAKGGVLFIDEAYAMKGDTSVTALIQEMENKRDEVIVILAGYNERMQNFLKINEGLKSRIPHWIDFPDYTTGELMEIFHLMMQERGFRVTEETAEEARYIFEKARTTEDFGNGRYVRNLIDRAAQNQAVRLLSGGKDAETLKKRELFLITKGDICMLEEGLKKERAAGSARKELDDMIGLSSVKEIIHKAIANYKLNRLCLEKGIARNKASLHMVFTGNPGTAKTTVARLFAEIMKDEKVLSTGHFVEAGRADLVGDHVGSTAPLVKRKFREAQGGVLFIDEAYALCDAYENGYGDEAINTLVQEMENHREDVIVVFAGYTEPMEKFLERNPGMSSRIAFRIDFPDYTTDELCDITKLMLAQKQMTITEEAMEKLEKIYESARTDSDYGNGRFVRKTLEEAEMNLAERVMQYPEDEITEALLTTIEVHDIPDPKPGKQSHKRQLGFAC